MQPSLLDSPVRFDSGVSLTAADHQRLGTQLDRLLSVVRDGSWWTVEQLQDEIFGRFQIRDPQASLSAQLRNARKEKHGGYTIERRRVGNFWQFRCVLPEATSHV
jgi:hypothetical protein